MKIISTIKTNIRPKWLPEEFLEFKCYYRLISEKIREITFYGTSARQFDLTKSR